MRDKRTDVLFFSELKTVPKFVPKNSKSIHHSMQLRLPFGFDLTAGALHLCEMWRKLESGSGSAASPENTCTWSFHHFRKKLDFFQPWDFCLPILWLLKNNNKNTILETFVACFFSFVSFFFPPWKKSEESCKTVTFISWDVQTKNNTKWRSLLLDDGTVTEKGKKWTKDHFKSPKGLFVNV